MASDGGSLTSAKQILPFKLDGFEFNTFSPLGIPPSDFFLLVQIDAFIDAGLTPSQFKELFTQCEVCGICIARTYLSNHSCETAMSSLPVARGGDRERLLQSVNLDGLPVERFEALFVYCCACGRIMTHRAAQYHSCE